GRGAGGALGHGEEERRTAKPGVLDLGSVRCIVAQEGRGTDGTLAEARGEPIDDGTEALTPQRRPIEERELALPRRPEARRGETDEPDGLGHRLAVQQRFGSPVEREAVLCGVARMTPGERMKVGVAELQRYPGRCELLLAQLARDTLGVGAQGLAQTCRIATVDT